MSLQRIHLRINDSGTGLPTPVRLRVTDAAGTYYAPFGHATDFPYGRGEDVGGSVMIGRDRWAYIDGACEIEVPPGELTFEATKGPLFKPLRETITLPAGKLAVRLAIERVAPPCPSGWFSGDIRAHVIAPHAALLEAAAEGLSIVNILARESAIQAAAGPTCLTYPNLLAFSGQQPCLSSDGHIVTVNTLNTHPVLGSLALLHCHRIVYPLTFGGPDHTDDWSLAAWCGQCHRKNGLVVWVDAFDAKKPHAGEALANLILGDIDTMELNPTDAVALKAWYRLLNAGFRVPIAGGSGKDSNRIALGTVRTYAQCAEEQFSLEGWIDAVRAGRTLVTSSPWLAFQVNGEGAGMVHRRAAGESRFRVQLAASAASAVDRSEVIVNGLVVATGTGPEIATDMDLPAGGWIAARCWTAGRLVAHTSPQYVEVDGAPLWIDPSAVAFLDDHLLRAREWVASEGRFDQPANRDRLLHTFDAARQALAAKCSGHSP